MSQLMGPKAIDRSEFDTSPHGVRIAKPWGWELHWTRADSPYVGKIIHINPGARLSLQVHESKSESWLLVSGRAKVIWENSKGELEESVLRKSLGYTCTSGQKHRLVGLTDCDIVEVSTPEQGTTWRLEDDFGRPHETEAVRNLERADSRLSA